LFCSGLGKIEDKFRKGWDSMYIFKRLWNPDIFQGKYKKRNYFEGWYYKLINQSKDHVLTVIPGISYGKNKADAHSFIQVMDSSLNQSHYFTFDIDQFHFLNHSFQINIANNFFTNRNIHIDLKNEQIHIHGELTFDHIIPFPKTFPSPGIMGPFSFVPFMECYHGIVNIHHEINGIIEINSSPISYSGGYGYIEKDWGRSFPKSWIWLQSNHFPQNDVSVMFSIAKIPWFHSYFIGHISFLRIKDTLYRFATYTGASIKHIAYHDGLLTIILEDKTHTLHIDAIQTKGEILKAPQKGMMDRAITESVTSTVKVHLYDKKKHLLFEGEGINTGLEIAGDITSLII
jgi:hypothetical protein